MRHFVVFPIPDHAKGNQHGGRKYEDLHDWLDMTSHENPLYAPRTFNFCFLIDLALREVYEYNIKH